MFHLNISMKESKGKNFFHEKILTRFVDIETVYKRDHHLEDDFFLNLFFFSLTPTRLAHSYKFFSVFLYLLYVQHIGTLSYRS